MRCGEGSRGITRAAFREPASAPEKLSRAIKRRTRLDIEFSEAEVLELIFHRDPRGSNLLDQVRIDFFDHQAPVHAAQQTCGSSRWATDRSCPI